MPTHYDSATLNQCAKSIRVRSDSDIVIVLVQRGGDYYIAHDGRTPEAAAALLRELAAHVTARDMAA